MSIYVSQEIVKKLDRDYKLALEIVGFESEEAYFRTYKNRNWKYFMPRQIAIWLVMGTGLYSNSLVGRKFLKDHSTVIYTCKRVNDLLEVRDPKYSGFAMDCYERFRLTRNFSTEELKMDEKLGVIRDALNQGFTCKRFFGVDDLYSQAKGFLVEKEREKNEQGNVG